MYVNSTNPSPRPGIKGLLDRITGPGATPAELLLQFVPSLVAAVAAPTYAVTLPIEWTPLQLGLIAFFGFDLVGGVLTNATSSAKRWYHRKGQGWQQHFAFVCLHIVHIFLVAKIIREGDWEFFLGTSMYLLGASVIILRSPLYLQRPVALLLYGLALLGNCYLFSPTPGLEWFVPLFFLKILVSHLLSDAPLHPGETR
ncbi:MAG: hypothetical protein ACFB2X_10230 [Rivularia sp. (in: cyanobacteria)]